MLKIVIADDEELIRMGLTKILKRTGKFQVVEEAADGKEALKVIGICNPDVVITDIKMPGLDGLELIKELNLRFPCIKKIVLSGFDEFKYAREAIRLGVFEYMLKPVDDDQLIEILSSIDKELEQEKGRKKDEILLKSMLNKSMPLLKEHHVSELVSYNTYSKEEIQKKLVLIDANLKGDFYRVFIVSLDNYRIMCDELGEKEAKLSSFMVRNIAEESVEKSVDFISCLKDNNLVLILSSKEEYAFQKTLDNLYENIIKHIGLRFTISVGSEYSEISSIYESYENALFALKKRFYNKKSEIIYYDHIDENKVNNTNKKDLMPSRIKQIEKTLKKSIESGDEHIAFESLELLYSTFYESKLNSKDVIEFFVKLYIELEIDYPEIKNTVIQRFSSEYSYMNVIGKSDTLDEVGRLNKEFYKEVFVRLESKRKNGHSKLISFAKEYIEDNYKENITLSKISEITYVNPNYFCAVFKAQTGENFIDYLTKVRIEKAKFFLKDVKVKAYEISEMVGYEDPTYFSKVFKKWVGVSPSEYRNMA